MRLENSVRLKVLVQVDRDDADIISKSLSIEATSTPSRRSRVSIKAIDDSIVMEAYAKDLVAMRAALNSFLRWMDMVLRIRSEIKSKG